MKSHSLMAPLSVTWLAASPQWGSYQTRQAAQQHPAVSFSSQEKGGLPFCSGCESNRPNSTPLLTDSRGSLSQNACQETFLHNISRHTKTSNTHSHFLEGLHVTACRSAELQWLPPTCTQVTAALAIKQAPIRRPWEVASSGEQPY